MLVRGGRLDDEAAWRWLARALARLNTMGKMNCLLSDGRRLFVWRDAAGFKGLSMRMVGFHNGAARRLAGVLLAQRCLEGTRTSDLD